MSKCRDVGVAIKMNERCEWGDIIIDMCMQYVFVLLFILIMNILIFNFTVLVSVYLFCML